MERIIEKVQVNIPFKMLHESYLSHFLEIGINPEIGLDAAALDQFSPSEGQDVAEALYKRGRTVTLHGPFMDLTPGSPDPEMRAVTRKRLTQFSRWVQAIKPKTVVCHTGWDPRRYQSLKERWLEHSVRTWKWFSGEIKAKGSKLMLENVYENSPYEFLDLFDRLKGQELGFCLDIGHLVAFGQADLAEWLDVLGHEISQLHLHDNNGEQDDHSALGRGKIDLHLVFNYYKKRRIRQPVITLEIHREDDLLPSLKYLESVWPW